MPSGRELFSCFLKGTAMERPAFVPLLRGLAARVGGVKAEAYTQDPTAWANLLIKTAELFNLDGVVAGLDFTLLAEACGCPVQWQDDRPVIAGPASRLCLEPEQVGRMKVALEKARHVFEVSRSRRACVAALTGPVSLAKEVFGPEEGLARLGEIKPLAVRVTEAFCATRPDVLIFLEGGALAQEEIGMPQRKIYNTLRNLAAHYDIPVGMFLQNYGDDLPPGLEELKMDFHVLGLSQDGGLPPRKSLELLAGEGLGLGIGLPMDDLEAAKETMSLGIDMYRARSGRGFFFTSLGPATREANLDTVHQLVKEISRVRL
ncbi:MAG: uroporphyrinogen decarboxylase family protein [Desulfarculus sp.]|nr:uroporphyrinogen decarboxylase family protein [Pseudomonadota bacterium]MBV1717463.1 uroporphyrinogen decarboxylase family protein [Desulfarculus sp.]MBU4573922.1 uroporphyrinogen decarboxylase family protein [Pseudomonadota bacterium]MBU4598759.1 uroporphyrinogen decarboxylase family protein [Pseudomonadota bacterium]MBV1740033.1 uroporphyrinogen decarboxylase family protein [Desulfarculus sp.]